MNAPIPSTDKQTRLIIVEDDLVSSFAMSMMLKDHGYIVLDNIVSADRILQDFENHIPDLILMDIRLNGDIDGTQAARILREKYDVPIIFVSAFNDEETKTNVNSITNSRIVNKPYDVSQIVSAIKSFKT